MTDREQQLFHRIFQLECERDRLKDDLAASQLIAARCDAALQGAYNELIFVTDYPDAVRGRLRELREMRDEVGQVLYQQALKQDE